MSPRCQVHQSWIAAGLLLTEKSGLTRSTCPRTACTSSSRIHLAGTFILEAEVFSTFSDQPQVETETEMCPEGTPAAPVRHLRTLWELGGTLFEKHSFILSCDAPNDTNFTRCRYLDCCDKPDHRVVGLGALKWRPDLGIDPETLLLTGSGVFLVACWSSGPTQGRLWGRPLCVSGANAEKKRCECGWLVCSGP